MHVVYVACQAAGSAFNILFKGGAGSAVDSVIPALLAGLEGKAHEASQALEGLRVILGVRPQTLGSMVRTDWGVLLRDRCLQPFTLLNAKACALFSGAQAA
jgi:hypothetical protein